MKRTALILLLVLVALLAGGAAFVHWVRLTMDRPAALSAPLVYTIPPHARIKQVAADLHTRGVVEHPRLWRLYARWQGLASQIKAGEYAIAPGSTPKKLLEQLVAGQVLLHSFTIVDGWQVRDLLAALRHSAEVRRTLPENPADLLQRLGLPAGPAEGQFLPETYKFPAGTTDVALLGLAHAALVKELAAAWAGRDPSLPLRSPQELLILASIVEKETALPAERARIAGVYVQRLQTGMRLQADPTVIYGLGERYDGDIRSADLRTDGPYNTYTRAGLPPTPIALPGLASLRATAKPEMTGELYFVASGVGDGSHVFSKTYEEHSRAVARYLTISRRRAARADSP
ncbi:MAG: endolytic transglycosylase MltG [Proteobacteria bacterium]|nr:endolytic transglycosylase MltG [Pseudomonadota bacterium]